jgi:mRNA interferase RelE/StbE
LAYNITFKKSVAKDLKKIGSCEADRIITKLCSDLSANAEQFPELQGQFAGMRKYRVGDYRVIYAIIGHSVLVVRIQHRKDVYRT